jgi:hypothetical protein
MTYSIFKHSSRFIYKRGIIEIHIVDHTSNKRNWNNRGLCVFFYLVDFFFLLVLTGVPPLSLVSSFKACEQLGSTFQWRVTASLLANLLGQNRHWCGFSPVCIKSWRFKSWGRANGKWHVSHLKGFSFVWVLVCDLRLYGRENSLVQPVYEQG